MRTRSIVIFAASLFFCLGSSRASAVPVDLSTGWTAESYPAVSGFPPGSGLLHQEEIALPSLGTDNQPSSIVISMSLAQR